MIPVADPGAGYRALHVEIDEAIARVMDSGWYILGPEVEAFESEFAAYIGALYAVGTNSGTDAITLALEALGIGKGDLVATVANSAIATVAAIIRAGAKPLLVDIDVETYTMSPSSLAKAMDRGIKAIVVVHLYGGGADISEIRRLASEGSVPLIEDCAQAVGLDIGGRKAGTYGEIGCFSFYPTKNLGALGDAGMLITDQQEIATRAKQLRQYGWDETRHSLVPGWNSRLDEIQAAVLRLKLSYLDGWNRRRVEIAQRYTNALHSASLVVPQSSQGHVFHLYVVRAPDRDRLRESLWKRQVNTAVHYPVPAHREEGFAGLIEVGPDDLSQTEEASRAVVSLPLYPELEDQQVGQVIDAVIESLGQS